MSSCIGLLAVTRSSDPPAVPVDGFNAAFIAGELSDYCTSEHVPRIQKYFARAERVEVLGAGHWVHSDKANEFVHIVCSSLKH